MGVYFHAGDKSVNMSCSTFNVIRRILANSFDPLYGKIYSKTAISQNKNAIGKYIATHYDILTYVCNETKLYLENHNDDYTKRFIHFLMLSDTEANIDKDTAKVVYQEYKKAYETGSDEIKLQLDYCSGYYKSMLDLLEFAMNNNGMYWN